MRRSGCTGLFAGSQGFDGADLRFCRGIDALQVVAMVGLPARGKTFMARRLKRHLSWIGYKTEIFNGAATG